MNTNVILEAVVLEGKTGPILSKEGLESRPVQLEVWCLTDPGKPYFKKVPGTDEKLDRVNGAPKIDAKTKALRS